MYFHARHFSVDFIAGKIIQFLRIMKKRRKNDKKLKWIKCKCLALRDLKEKYEYSNAPKFTLSQFS